MSPEVLLIFFACGLPLFVVLLVVLSKVRNDESGQTFSDSDDDPVMQEVIRRCWTSGNMVIGSMDDDGKVTIEEFPMDDEEQKQ